MSPMNTGRTRVARTFRLAVAATQAVWPILPVTTSTGVCCTRKASIKRGSGAIARASITTTANGTARNHSRAASGLIHPHDLTLAVGRELRPNERAFGPDRRQQQHHSTRPRGAHLTPQNAAHAPARR